MRIPAFSRPTRRKSWPTSWWRARRKGIGCVFRERRVGAIEGALKLARQYFVELGESKRRYVIARRQSYHGITLGALAVGGRERQRKAFAPLLFETHHVSPVFEYRERRANETSEAYGERLAEELDDKIEELGGENVMAFVAETVVGATLGAVPAVPGYFQRVREVCDRHGVLLILDEVMCGMGRTGTLHACEQEGITPDLIAIAKGLGGGYAPIGALLMQERIFDAVADGSGAFQHSHTYMGHPLACAAALAVQRVIHRDGLLATCARRAHNSLADSRSDSAITRLSGTCADAASFRRLSWSLIAVAKRRSSPSTSCMPG